MNQLNPAVFSREQIFLESYLKTAEAAKLIDAQTINDAAAGNLKARQKHHYFRKKILSLSGELEFIKSVDEMLEGTSSISKGKLPKGTVYCVGAIGLKYSQNSNNAATDPGAQLFSSEVYNPQNYAAGSVDLDAGGTGNQFAPVEVPLIPTALLNAECELVVGETQEFQGLVGDFFRDNKFANSVGASDFQSVVLKKPIIIPGERAVKFNIKFPENQTLANTVAHFLGIEFYGMEAGPRA